MTPVGDIEVEIVFRIAVRGRACDLAQLMEAVNKALRWWCGSSRSRSRQKNKVKKVSQPLRELIRYESRN